MRQLSYGPRAAIDIESIIIYVGEVLRAPEAAESLYRKIRQTVQDLCATPEIGRPYYDETLDRKQYRSFLVEQYRIFYTYDEKTLTVWRVIHTRQDIDDYALIEWNE